MIDNLPEYKIFVTRYATRAAHFIVAIRMTRATMLHSWISPNPHPRGEDDGF